MDAEADAYMDIGDRAKHGARAERIGIYSQRSWKSSRRLSTRVSVIIEELLSMVCSTTLESTKSNYWANGDLWARSGIRTLLCLLLTTSVAFAVQ